MDFRSHRKDIEMMSFKCLNDAIFPKKETQKIKNFGFAFDFVYKFMYN